MRTKAEDIRIQEFAQQCMNSLRIVKDSMPGKWEAELAPFIKEIRDTAKTYRISESDALDKILDDLAPTTRNRDKLKTTYTFYMAAYCLML